MPQPRTTREGTLRIGSISPETYELFFAAGNRRPASITVRSEERVPCPSLWHHPLAWLRWNPLLIIRMTSTLPSAQIVPTDSPAQWELFVRDQ